MNVQMRLKKLLPLNLLFPHIYELVLLIYGWIVVEKSSLTNKRMIQTKMSLFFVIINFVFLVVYNALVTKDIIENGILNYFLNGVGSFVTSILYYYSLKVYLDRSVNISI